MFKVQVFFTSIGLPRLYITKVADLLELSLVYNNLIYNKCPFINWIFYLFIFCIYIFLFLYCTFFNFKKNVTLIFSLIRLSKWMEWSNRQNNLILFYGLPKLKIENETAPYNIMDKKQTFESSY